MILPGWLFVLLLSAAPPAAASAATAASNAAPADDALSAARLDQHIGATLPLELPFLDEHGHRVTLADYFDAKPVILAPVWYSCPDLCNVTLNGLAAGLAGVDFRAGADYRVVAVSIDPRDGAERAAALETELMQRSGNSANGEGWHLLTGSQAAVSRLMDTIGFRYRYDERTGQYAHPATIALVAADGRVTRYLPGIEFPPPDLRLALLETARGNLGSVVDTVLLRCFSYDPATGRYTLAIVGLLRVLGTLTVLGLGAALAAALIREHRRRRT